MKKLLTLILVILIAGCSIKPEESYMAVEFEGSNDQYVDFGSPAYLDNINPKTISFWVYMDVVQGIAIDKSDVSGAVQHGWDVQLYNGSSNLVYHQGFDTASGEWQTDASSLSASAWTHVAITYDNSSVNNNPVMYIDGASANVTESITPEGSLYSDADYTLRIGNRQYLSNLPINGILQDVRIYDVIKSAAEIEEIYKNRVLRNVAQESGFVFWLSTYGLAGMSAFDGVALSESNKIPDQIGSAEGTPYGSPIGRGNTIHRIY